MWGALEPATRALHRAGSAPAPPPELSPAHRSALAAAAPVYRSVWWPLHDRANRGWIAEQEPLVRAHGAAIQRRISAAFGEPWPVEAVPVEVVAYATWSGAFEIDGPPLVHISSAYAAHAGSGGLEQLHHEAGHAISGRIVRDLQAEAERQGGSYRRGVWRHLAHHLLFYTAGWATQQSIPDHVPYAEAWGVRDRDPEMHELVSAHWRPYLEGGVDYRTALGAIVRAAGDLP